MLSELNALTPLSIFVDDERTSLFLVLLLFLRGRVTRLLRKLNLIMVYHAASALLWVVRVGRQLVEAVSLMIGLDIGVHAANFICSFGVGFDIVLFEVHFDWPVDDDKHVDVQIAHGVCEKLHPTIPEVPRENTKHDTENEEEVYDLPAAVGDLACIRNFLISQAEAAHSQGNHELDVVEDEEAECNDDGPEVRIDLMLAGVLLEDAVQARISLHVDVVGAAEGHKAGDHDDEEEEQVEGGALVVALAAENEFFEAAPARVRLCRSHVCQLAQPENKHS